MKNKLLIFTVLILVSNTLFAHSGFDSWLGIELAKATFSYWYIPIFLVLKFIMIHFVFTSFTKNKYVLLLIFTLVSYIIGTIIYAAAGMLFSAFIGYVVLANALPDYTPIELVLSPVLSVLLISLLEYKALKIYEKQNVKPELKYLFVCNILLVSMATIVLYI